MTDTFNPGDRVYHEVLGTYGTWLEYVPSTSGPRGYSRVEMEDANGRKLLCPTSTLVPAEREA